MSNLDNVPEYGALISVTFPKPNQAESFPARAFAILPGEYCSKGKRILAN